MTARLATTVVIRIWAVMLLGRTLMASPALLAYLSQSSGSSVDASVLYNARLSAFASLGVQLVVAAVMFATAPRIAAWITTDDEPVAIAMDAPALMAVGLGIFGLSVLVDGILELGPTLYTWINTPADPSSNLSFLTERRSTALIRGSLEIVIGLALFLGRDALLRAWRRARTQEG